MSPARAQFGAADDVRECEQLPIKKFFLTSEQTDKDKSLVNRVSCALFVLLIVASAFARSEAPEVIFVSPCECQGFHGKTRWVTKTDSAPIPSDKFAIQSVTPSQIYAWEGPGPDVDLTRYTEERMPSEQKWYALTGRIVGLKVEADGDIHLALGKMRPETQWEPLALRFLSVLNGARFGRLFLVGRRKAFLSI
jgi:hypothetical protein